MAAQWLDHILQGPAVPDLMTRIFPWAAAMIGCPHDSVYHAEGDPWTHTCLVAAALEQTEGFDALDPARRDRLRLSAWMHDIAKPITTEVGWDEAEGRERVRQPNHAPKGAIMAWQGLIDAGCPADLARDVFTLVFWHQRPSHMVAQNMPPRRAIHLATEMGPGGWEDLLRLCIADQKGRISVNQQATLDDLALAALMIEELGAVAGANLMHEPWPFASEEARLRYLRQTGPDLPFHTPQAPQGSRMVLVSGLPGSGKDTMIGQRFADLPVISLDQIRAELKVSHDDNQGPVRVAAFARARAHLRAGEDFVFNATSLTRVSREKIIGLVRDYDGSVEGWSVDVPLDVALTRNRGRAEPLPDRAIIDLARKREPILASEVHTLWSLDAAGRARRLIGGEVGRAEPETPAP